MVNMCLQINCGLTNPEDTFQSRTFDHYGIMSGTKMPKYRLSILTVTIKHDFGYHNDSDKKHPIKAIFINEPNLLILLVTKDDHIQLNSR